MKVRIAEHVADVHGAYTQQLGASRHFSTLHEGKIGTMQVYAIEHVPKPLTGGNWQRQLLNSKAFWILRLGSCIPDGMNLRSDLMYIY